MKPPPPPASWSGASRSQGVPPILPRWTQPAKPPPVPPRSSRPSNWKYLRPKELKALKNLLFAARIIVEGIYSGRHKSPYRGSSPEFVDYREYNPGDEIRSISGIFSGTLAYLFNLFDGTRPFSEIVREAKAKGYTEPDPRDDLSGKDVARKAVILAREAGLKLELDEIAVESLVPAALSEASVDEFLRRLPDFDAPRAERVAAAKLAGKVLRYVASIDVQAGKAQVGLESFAPQHPFASISLTDNIVQFVTGRYCDNPLIIRGPGAGPAVTAGGIFADLLRLCSMLSGNHN